MDLLRIASHSNRAREALREFLAGRETLVTRPFETTSSFNTIAALLAHSAGAEERWLARVRGVDAGERLEARIASSPLSVWTEWDRIRAVTMEFLGCSDDARLDSEVEFELAQWQTKGRLTTREVLFHVFNHENYHRGQISMVLQQFGEDPPNFDYPLLMSVSAR